MDLPNPSDFHASKTKKRFSESIAQDLLQEFHGHERHRPNEDSTKPGKDRRLNLMRHLCEHGVLDEERSKGASKIDPDLNKKFLGETLVSQCAL